MITFEDLLARASDLLLQELVGRRVVRLLARLDPALATPDRLREVVEELRSPAEMLLDPRTRGELLQLLPTEAAHHLAADLMLDGTDPFDALAQVQVRKGSARAAALLDFFSVSPDPPAADQEVPDGELLGPHRALFPHQRKAARAVLAELATEPHRVLLHMPTGSGKTRTAMSVICERMNQSEPFLAVWLAHSEELCEQAATEFRSAWTHLGNREVSVHRWWGHHPLPATRITEGLVVAGLSKAFASSRRDWQELGGLAGRVGLVVMDEAHQAIAPSYEHVLNLLSLAGSPAPLLGLSATPGRTWNDIDEDQRLADFFYRQKVTLQIAGYENPVDFLVDEGYLASTEFQTLHSHVGVELTPRDLADLRDGLDLPTRVLEMLAEDEQRNLLIVHRAEQLARTNKRIIIFAATVEHALVLAAVLRSRGLWARAVTGKTPRTERARAIADFRSDTGDARILVNYGVLTTGFDAPATSAAVIARPTASLVLYSQMVGRAIRGPRAGGNSNATISTVVDPGLEGFASPADAFTNWEDVWE